jgi:deoxyadenosine/deoxycytidine kinase
MDNKLRNHPNDLQKRISSRERPFEVNRILKILIQGAHLLYETLLPRWSLLTKIKYQFDIGWNYLDERVI